MQSLLKINRWLISLTLVGLLFSTTTTLSAQNSNRKGIYGIPRNLGINISAGGNYFFGDIEQGSIIEEGALNNMGFNGSISLLHDVSPYLQMQYGVNAGILRGLKFPLSFNSLIIEPTVMLAYYPIKIYSPIGRPYISAGIGAAYVQTLVSSGTETIAKTCFVPIVPVNIGYRFTFNERWMLGLELGTHFAVIDTPNSTLDGYPMTLFDQVNSESFFLDGFYTVALTFGYHF